MNEALEYLQTFARFPFALRKFLQQRLTLDDAKRIVREGMEHREENFLRMVDRSVYGYPNSPYLPLLKMAGCELGDLRARVQQKGLEGALRDLRAAGVYITFEEFKGRQPIIRNGLTIPVMARDFDNPSMQRVFTLETGGSSGAAMNVGVDLDFVLDRSPHELLSLLAHDCLDAPSIRWNGILPAGTLRNIMRQIPFGHVPTRWFSPVGLRDSRHWLKYAAATYYIIFWLRLLGVRVPFPEYVGVEKSELVARAMGALLATHPSCLIHCSVSRALRVSLAAQKLGIDLAGANFSISSEPATLAKAKGILQSGGRCLPNYGTVETNRIATGCATPNAIDDMHVFKDAFVLFDHPYPIPGFGITVPAFNLTNLIPTAPKVMLNVQMDDYGVVEERSCGCELANFGYTTHLREIRSYTKLTGEGVTLIGNEILSVLENVLPTRFGGSPLDYQLVEEEDAQGFTRLCLVISPRVAIADEHQVIDVMLQALSHSSPMADAASTIWQQTHTLQIKRMEPQRTARGKLLPLYLLQRPQNSETQRG